MINLADLTINSISFENSLHIPKLTHLTFGEKFNGPLGNLLNNLSKLTHLTFGKRFNQPLGNSLNNLSRLTHLTFGEYFNQPLGYSLHNLSELTHLTFGKFDKPLGKSLDNLIKLTNLTINIKYKKTIICNLYKFRYLKVLNILDDEIYTSIDLSKIDENEIDNEYLCTVLG